MHKVAIIARLKDGCEPKAAELLAKGPPFDPQAHGFDCHTAYLSAGEVMFVFEGPEVDVALDDLITDPSPPVLISALDSWRPLVEGQPRIARALYEWKRQA